MDAVPKRILGTAVAVARLYHRMETDIRAPLPAGPVLFVANHGFGGVFDLNVLAFYSAYERIGGRRKVAVLTHQIAWTLKVGRLVELFDATPANHRNAVHALRSGSHVLVFPGGDIDGFKRWSDRNRVLFAGRTGYARVAVEAGVPIVPVVTAGAGESLVVLAEGKRLARWTRADKLLRVKTVATSVSIPWGLNVGLVGLLPYLPLPSKISTTVLPAMEPADGESVEDFAARVHRAMDDELQAMTTERTPIVG
ncbi:1-acyl-sn-glycerol-3-phosphate acyltransferase [Rhodococcoides kroppenstedtii]|uniref:1-acyl-sn-glycerol-3-phosphate acyltransferase n=1 Tax=Rhodococcoides kroppenstedtii TaxID=293050 RepID=UPI001C9AA45D|nr:1-acyl-sn-glycerol-3-phosphate acyltransferase [Rhodococcus kroppenstedtii]MBY6435136.1 1-acyl-sn-glycerol-3-phosphate acyltransferase [Rhodococcus kroppenstedtii]